MWQSVGGRGGGKSEDVGDLHFDGWFVVRPETSVVVGRSRKRLYESIRSESVVGGKWNHAKRSLALYPLSMPRLTDYIDDVEIAAAKVIGASSARQAD